MNEREVGEIRRRFKPERNSFSHIRGCYVNELGHIVSQFDQSLAMMSQDETELFLSVLRKTLSGGLGKNLMDIEFETQQVAYGEQHRLLMDLRNSGLKDNAAVQTFFEKVAGAVKLEDCSYLILLVHDTYDVPYRTKGGDRQDDAGDQVYSYILCSICPITETKPALSYYMRENEFHNRQMNQLVSAPEMGFLFPAFDDWATNLYNALCYTKDPSQNHQEFIDAVFGAEAPMPATAQKENFRTVLGEALEEDCSYEVVQAVHDQLREMIAVHKENKEKTPLKLSKGAATGVLRSCGVSAEKAEVFERKFDQTFGEETEISARNLEVRQTELRTPDVVIHVNPDRGDLIKTKVIDGRKYILICADDGVEVNGVDIKIN